MTERVEVVVLPAWSIAIAPDRCDAGPTTSGDGCRAALPYLTISPAIPIHRTVGSNKSRVVGRYRHDD
jgi:hypothetical protein